MNVESDDDFEYNILIKCKYCDENADNNSKIVLIPKDNRKKDDKDYHICVCDNCKYRNGTIYMISHRTNKYLNNNNFYYIGVSLDLQIDMLKHRSNAYHFERIVNYNPAYLLYYLINRREESICSFLRLFHNQVNTNEWVWSILGNATTKIELDMLENHFIELYKPKLNQQLNNGLYNKYCIGKCELDIKMRECEKHIRNKYIV